jgi:hypothetical protein
MAFFDNFFDILIYTLWFVVLISFFVVLVRIVVDVFRDDELGGWGKAGWVLFVVFLPILGSLIYLFARGDGMARRDFRDERATRDAYRAHSAAAAPAASALNQVEVAKGLLDSGAITQQEFDALKAKALR